MKLNYVPTIILYNQSVNLLVEFSAIAKQREQDITTIENLAFDQLFCLPIYEESVRQIPLQKRISLFITAQDLERGDPDSSIEEALLHQIEFDLLFTPSGR